MAILMDFQALFVWTLEQPFSGHSNPCHMISGIGHCDERREIFFRRFASNAIEALLISDEIEILAAGAVADKLSVKIIIHAKMISFSLIVIA